LTLIKIFIYFLFYEQLHDFFKLYYVGYFRLSSGLYRPIFMARFVLRLLHIMIKKKACVKF